MSFGTFQKGPKLFSVFNTNDKSYIRLYREIEDYPQNHPEYFLCEGQILRYLLLWQSQSDEPRILAPVDKWEYIIATIVESERIIDRQEAIQRIRSEYVVCRKFKQAICDYFRDKLYFDTHPQPCDQRNSFDDFDDRIPPNFYNDTRRNAFLGDYSDPRPSNWSYNASHSRGRGRYNPYQINLKKTTNKPAFAKPTTSFNKAPAASTSSAIKSAAVLASEKVASESKIDAVNKSHTESIKSIALTSEQISSDSKGESKIETVKTPNTESIKSIALPSEQISSDSKGESKIETVKTPNTESIKSIALPSGKISSDLKSESKIETVKTPNTESIKSIALPSGKISSDLKSESKIETVKTPNTESIKSIAPPSGKISSDLKSESKIETVKTPNTESIKSIALPSEKISSDSKSESKIETVKTPNTESIKSTTALSAEKVVSNSKIESKSETARTPNTESIKSTTALSAEKVVSNSKIESKSETARTPNTELITIVAAEKIDSDSKIETKPQSNTNVKPAEAYNESQISSDTEPKLTQAVNESKTFSLIDTQTTQAKTETATLPIQTESKSTAMASQRIESQAISKTGSLSTNHSRTDSPLPQKSNSVTITSEKIVSRRISKTGPSNVAPRANTPQKSDSVTVITEKHLSRSISNTNSGNLSPAHSRSNSPAQKSAAMTHMTESRTTAKSGLAQPVANTTANQKKVPADSQKTTNKVNPIISSQKTASSPFTTLPPPRKSSSDHNIRRGSTEKKENPSSLKSAPVLKHGTQISQKTPSKDAQVRKLSAEPEKPSDSPNKKLLNFKFDKPVQNLNTPVTTGQNVSTRRESLDFEACITGKPVHPSKSSSKSTSAAHSPKLPNQNSQANQHSTDKNNCSASSVDGSKSKISVGLKKPEDIKNGVASIKHGESHKSKSAENLANNLKSKTNSVKKPDVAQSGSTSDRRNSNNLKTHNLSTSQESGKIVPAPNSKETSSTSKNLPKGETPVNTCQKKYKGVIWFQHDSKITCENADEFLAIIQASDLEKSEWSVRNFIDGNIKKVLIIESDKEILPSQKISSFVFKNINVHFAPNMTVMSLCSVTGVGQNQLMSLLTSAKTRKWIHVDICKEALSKHIEKITALVDTETVELVKANDMKWLCSPLPDGRVITFDCHFSNVVIAHFYSVSMAIDIHDSTPYENFTTFGLQIIQFLQNKCDKLKNSAFTIIKATKKAREIVFDLEICDKFAEYVNKFHSKSIPWQSIAGTSHNINFSNLTKIPLRIQEPVLYNSQQVNSTISHQLTTSKNSSQTANIPNKLKPDELLTRPNLTHDDQVHIALPDYPLNNLELSQIETMKNYISRHTTELKKLKTDITIGASIEGLLQLRCAESGKNWIKDKLDALQKKTKAPVVIIDAHEYRVAVWLKNEEINPNMTPDQILLKIKEAVPGLDGKKCKMSVMTCVKGPARTTLWLDTNFAAVSVMVKIGYTWKFNENSNAYFCILDN